MIGSNTPKERFLTFLKLTLVAEWQEVAMVCKSNNAGHPRTHIGLLVSGSPASYQSPAVTWEETLVSLCVLPPCCPLTEIKNVILPARGESS